MPALQQVVVATAGLHDDHGVVVLVATAPASRAPRSGIPRGPRSRTVDRCRRRGRPSAAYPSAPAGPRGRRTAAWWRRDDPSLAGTFFGVADHHGAWAVGPGPVGGIGASPTPPRSPRSPGRCVGRGTARPRSIPGRVPVAVPVGHPGQQRIRPGCPHRAARVRFPRSSWCRRHQTSSGSPGCGNSSQAARAPGVVRDHEAPASSRTGGLRLRRQAPAHPACPPAPDPARL